MQQIRTLICEDIDPIRRRYALILSREKDICVIGQAATGEEGVRIALEEKPDVVLMDIEMETHTAGIDACRRILKQLPETKCIVLTVHRNDELIFEAFNAGVVDYMFKNVSPAEIVESVRNALHNNSVIHPEISARLMREFRRLQRTNASLLSVFNQLFRLSRTELEILELFLHGMTRAEVCQARMVELSTTKSQIRSILQKTEYDSIQDLVSAITSLNMVSLVHSLVQKTAEP